MSARIALIVSYDGSSLHGYQYQSEDLPTVQGCLETALAQVADHKVSLTCAGRTDAGVHATHQVVHFDTTSKRPVRAWIRGANRYLPDAIKVNSAQEVSSDFHARFSATARRYLYLIDNSPVRSSFLVHGLTHEPQPLDVESMHEAAGSLIGEHDFTSFRAALCQSNTPYRNIHRLTVRRLGRVVLIDVTANAFLYHMVRNIAGALIHIGLGRGSIDWVGELLVARDRRLAPKTAPADGLYLVDVSYPESFSIPAGPDLPHLFSYLAPALTDG